MRGRFFKNSEKELRTLSALLTSHFAGRRKSQALTSAVRPATYRRAPSSDPVESGASAPSGQMIATQVIDGRVADRELPQLFDPLLDVRR
jgi:hypothetical protein